MNKLISNFIRWTIRNILSFVMILILLTCGKILLDKYQEYQKLKKPHSSWDQGLIQSTEFTKLIQDTVTNSQKTLNKLDKSKKSLTDRSEDIKAQLKKLNEEKSNKESEIKKCIFSPIKDCPTAITDVALMEVEIGLLSQEVNVIEKFIKSVQDSKSQIKKAHDEHVNAYENWQKVSTDFENCNKVDPVKKIFILMSGKCKEEMVEKALNESNEKWKYYTKLNSERLNPGMIDKLNDPQVKLFDNLKSHASTEREKYESNIFSTIFGKLENEFLAAIQILLATILTPVLIKLFFYYLVAPFAAMRPAISMIKSSRGDIDNLPDENSENSHGVTISKLTYSLEIDENEELFIKDEYISDLATEGSRKTRFLLNWSFPLTSLASGLYAITQIRTTSKEVINIQATHESLYEVGVLSIPDGTAIVLKPHKLIGLVQDKSRPIKITRHWKLDSLHAWLTLQLRYMVFHGPGKLIIKGCKGIQVAPANSGRSINQLATIGFTANIEYSNSRTETFYPYMKGKKELFNDNFCGTSGYYVYETLPYADKKGGLFGRGIEGLTDSALNIFGI